MCAPLSRATSLRYGEPLCPAAARHYSLPSFCTKITILRHVDVHIRFDTTPIYLYSFQLLASLQRLIAKLGSTQIYCRFHIRVLLNCYKKLPLTNCSSRCCYVCAAAARHFAPLLRATGHSRRAQLFSSIFLHQNHYFYVMLMFIFALTRRRFAPFPLLILSCVKFFSMHVWL